MPLQARLNSNCPLEEKEERLKLLGRRAKARLIAGPPEDPEAKREKAKLVKDPNQRNLPWGWDKNDENAAQQGIAAIAPAHTKRQVKKPVRFSPGRGNGQASAVI